MPTHQAELEVGTEGMGLFGLQFAIGRIENQFGLAEDGRHVECNERLGEIATQAPMRS